MPFQRGFAHTTSRLVPQSSSADLTNRAETFEIPSFVRLSTVIRIVPFCRVASAHAMNALGARETMQQKLIEATSVTQPTLMHGETASQRLVQQDTCDSLRQYAGLLEAGSKARRAFVDFLKGPKPHTATSRHAYAWQGWR